ncbi:unnamed protein product [Lota lota]
MKGPVLRERPREASITSSQRTGSEGHSQRSPGREHQERPVLPLLLNFGLAHTLAYTGHMKVTVFSDLKDGAAPEGRENGEIHPGTMVASTDRKCFDDNFLFSGEAVCHWLSGGISTRVM